VPDGRRSVVDLLSRLDGANQLGQPILGFRDAHARLAPDGEPVVLPSDEALKRAEQRLRVASLDVPPTAAVTPDGESVLRAAARVLGSRLTMAPSLASVAGRVWGPLDWHNSLQSFGRPVPLDDPFAPRAERGPLGTRPLCGDGRSHRDVPHRRSPEHGSGHGQGCAVHRGARTRRIACPRSASASGLTSIRGSDGSHSAPPPDSSPSSAAYQSS
jgi:hypothetical protein